MIFILPEIYDFKKMKFPFFVDWNRQFGDLRHKKKQEILHRSPPPLDRHQI